MLKYFKYLAVISFTLVLAAAFFAGLYFRHFAADAVIKLPVLENNRDLAERYRDEIVCKYSPILEQLAQTPIKQWDENKYFVRFKKLSSTVLGAVPVEKINVYNQKRELLFSTNKSEIVFFDSEEKNLINQGQTIGEASKLHNSMGINDENGVLKKGSYVQTFIAVNTSSCLESEDNKTSKVEVILEVFNEVTTSWQKLYFFQALVSIGIVATFLLLYLALFITSRKTEKLINKQHEEKLNLEKAKSRAEAQNQQKSMFLANVSHELRTPLNAIIGFSEIIKNEVMGPVGHPQYKEYISDINSSGVHLLSLINDILDYSKAEARKLDVEAVDVDLSKIAHSCLRLIEPRANQSKVKLIENMPDKHVILEADPKRMKQIILNLLSNAVKFTPEDGEVAMTIREDILSGEVMLTVVDTGIGIAQKDISKAMAPFGQIDSSVSRRYEGTGLGLPLSKKLTELMGGKFEIKSEIGLGTTVLLTFPLMKNKEQENLDKF